MKNYETCFKSFTMRHDPSPSNQSASGRVVLSSSLALSDCTDRISGYFDIHVVAVAK